MSGESKCISCYHCEFYPATHEYDAEWECKEESSNFMTDDGCYMYEENILDRD